MLLVHLGVFLVAFLLLQWELPRTEAHPQCLDSLPPFDRPRHWCRDYRPETCCTREDERKLIFDELLPAIRKMSSEDNRRGCTNLLIKVLCTRCSPWAQHVYEDVPSEGFPSLCEPFCQRFFISCYSTIFSLFSLNSSSYERTVEDAGRFCAKFKAPFSHYCYPDIIKGPNEEGTDLPSYEQDEGCLCGAEVASGLRNPVAAVPAGDLSGRLFIVEQKGKILVLTRDNDVLDEPFLDISDRVLTSRRRADERGLLGLAFSPNYKTNGRFYVYYSSWGRRLLHQSTVSEFHVSALNPNRADPTSERVIMTIPQPEANHNGGQLFFGVDGYLYIALGDGGGAGDRHGRVGHGLDLTTLLGSMLRIDVSNPNVTYSIPEDNPFAAANSSARPEIYAYGLRNPWRCSVDRGDKDGVGKGRIFCGDVGQARFEEIDIIEKGGNYGWRAFEGFSCYDRRLCTPEFSELSSMCMANGVVSVHHLVQCTPMLFSVHRTAGDVPHLQLLTCRRFVSHWWICIPRVSLPRPAGTLHLWGLLKGVSATRPIACGSLLHGSYYGGRLLLGHTHI